MRLRQAGRRLRQALGVHGVHGPCRDPRAGQPGLGDDEAAWDRIIDINLRAHIRAAKAVVPEWVERGGGHFVAVASAAGLLTQLGAAPYSVTKHAAIGFAEWLAIRYGDNGIGVSCVCPMGVDTPLLRGNVANVDTDGVYVSMPGSRGVLRGPYLTLQDVAVGDRVLTVTTDDGETVIVGLASAAAPRSTPATSTDNAVARFDGTGGALQNSGVTIDDSNNVNITDASDVALRVIASTGNPYLVRRAEDGSDLYDSWQSPTTTTRFQLRVTQTQWRLQRSESGTFDVLTAERTSGRVTIGAAGTTAGIELGSGGPTITTGTGAPSHSAPNGSVYLRQDGTAATTLYIRAGGAWSALT